jgi:TetR/AcrR family transcriptional regulator, transcriptional repressor for nem operon
MRVKFFLYQLLQIMYICRMGRNIEFAYNMALEHATMLFWKKGYSNTSLRDLLSVMKIGEGSFYNCFKSKKNLYLECLKHYNETLSKRRLAILQTQPSAHHAIRAFFKQLLDELDNPETPRVCLMAGSLTSEVLEEQDLSEYVVNEMKYFTEQFISRLNTAKKTGELPKEFDSKLTAQTLVTYLQGMFRTVRVLHDRKQIEKQIEILLLGLGL